MKHDRLAFDSLLDLLDHVMTRIGAMHSSPHDFGTGVALFRAEIHTIRAIGKNPRINVTALAEHINVTKGAVSQTISKLTRKGLVSKTHARHNAKEVLLELTDLGWKGFHAHERFHAGMFDVVRDYFGDDLESRIELFATVMTDLDAILSRFEQPAGPT